MNSRATYFTSIIFTFFLSVFSTGCQFIDDQKSPPGYQLNRPQKEILKKKLAEISEPLKKSGYGNYLLGLVEKK